MRAFLIALLVAFTATAIPLAAQDAAYYRMRGTIGKGIPIEAFLSVRKGGGAVGSYLYSKVGIPIFVSGEVSAAGKLKLTEFDYLGIYDSTGSFEGVLSKGVAKGNWKSPDGKKVLPFELKVDFAGATAFTPVARFETKPIVTDAADSAMATASMDLLAPKAGGKLGALVEKELYGGKKASEWAAGQAAVFFEQYAVEASGLAAEDPSSDFLNWELAVDCFVVYEGGGYLCLCKTTYEFAGGAHPNSWVEYVVLDLKAMRRVELKDFFGDEALGALGARISAAIRERLEPGQTLEDAGYFPDSIAPTENFILSPAGILFEFNPVEIAAFAVGSTKVMFTWDELKELLSVRPKF